MTTPDISRQSAGTFHSRVKDLYQRLQNPALAYGIDATYRDHLTTLSQGSVRRRFDPYLDIDWDSPELRVDHDDPRWILTDEDPIGRHQWYQAQPVERQIAIGIWRYANIYRVGLQFESMLVRGLHQYAMKVPNGSPEFRYALHEAAEECNHSMMFQEFINRLGVDTPGAPRWVRIISPLIPLALCTLPPLFFVAVLSGEEPIDHQQKSILRSNADIHPMFVRLMEIHIAEEARHISFAHDHLRQYVPQLVRPYRWLVSIFFPVAMRVACNIIIKPPREFEREFGIPRRVMREIYWREPESRKILSEYFGDVRTLAVDTRLMNPVARVAWKLLRIDGPPSRYRGEPVRSDREGRTLRTYLRPAPAIASIAPSRRQTKRRFT